MSTTSTMFSRPSQAHKRKKRKLLIVARHLGAASFDRCWLQCPRTNAVMPFVLALLPARAQLPEAAAVLLNQALALVDQTEERRVSS